MKINIWFLNTNPADYPKVGWSSLTLFHPGVFRLYPRKVIKKYQCPGGIGFSPVTYISSEKSFSSTDRRSRFYHFVVTSNTFSELYTTQWCEIISETALIFLLSCVLMRILKQFWYYHEMNVSEIYL